MTWVLLITLSLSTGDITAQLADHPSPIACAIAADRHLTTVGEPALCEPRSKG